MGDTLKDRVSVVEKSVSGLEGAVRSVAQQHNELVNSVAKLSDTLLGLTTQVTQLANTVKKLMSERNAAAGSVSKYR